MLWSLNLTITTVLLCLARPSKSYIPAIPTNSTQDAITGGLNVTDISQLYMQWYFNGFYDIHVSYQLAGFNSSGISKGVLVHFSEEKVSTFTPPTSTPWIALISCDKNATDASMEEDIFTLARDKGAVSALLYSLHSVACVINPSYSDPASFDQVFDIFSSQSLTSSHVIEFQFTQLTPQNTSLFDYDSQVLNNSFADIEKSVATGNPVSAGYMFAVLRAYNSTESFNVTPPGNNDATTRQGTGSNPPNTALAMIILYAITGCVSALFCIVIISGAIRAIRHPERYGPRARLGDDMPQSRARGLTRAILDTFPIVKFGNVQTRSGSDEANASPEKTSTSRDPEANIEMGNLSVTYPQRLSNELPSDANLSEPSGSGAGTSSVKTLPNKASLDTRNSTHPQSPSSGDGQSPDDTRQEADGVGEGSSQPSAAQAPRSEQDMVPASIGRETCPICIVDFEEGDDIRVLPCEGNHCFHQECVDPWLLKLSSSCPICRHDFLALENMMSGHPDDEDEPEAADSQPTNARGHVAPNQGRFSRYLRFVRHRRRGDEPDPTDPYMPTAPETSMYSGM